MSGSPSSVYALVGNPNSGKTTIYNHLTGRQERTGNYPGVTTAISESSVRWLGSEEDRLLDLPGAYSLYPNTQDERALVDLLLASEDALDVDGLIYVLDVTAIRQQCLLLSQLRDLGHPCVVVLTHADQVDPARLESIISVFSTTWSMPILTVDVRKEDPSSVGKHIQEAFHQVSTATRGDDELQQLIKKHVNETTQVEAAHGTGYYDLLRWHHDHDASDDNSAPRKERLSLQIQETLMRYQEIDEMLSRMRDSSRASSGIAAKLEAMTMHPVWGSLFFFALLFLIFQAIFSWASWPMDQIDAGMTWLQDGAKEAMGDGMWSDFLADGLLAGIGGVLIFIPQIALLFLLIGFMEASGYMARAVYMFDHIMRKFGMSGRSLVSLMAAGACAIPAIMGTRTIASKKERLITILVSPFISCAARIPVYTVLIGLAVPATTVLGLFNLQGVVFMGLYVFSTAVALITGWALSRYLKQEKRSPLVMILPDYKWPRLLPIFRYAISRTKEFVFEAGRVIIVLSMVLWALSSFGPQEAMLQAEQMVAEQVKEGRMDPEEVESELASAKMSASYAGHMGRAIEPIIRPLGYDWKIGIGLISAFAAREVFVGAIATLYSLDGREEEHTLLRERLRRARFEDTKTPVFTLATAVSLMVFFMLAMQCMSTLAVVRQETKTWKWPIFQFSFMLVLAYIGAWMAYQIFS